MKMLFHCLRFHIIYDIINSFYQQEISLSTCVDAKKTERERDKRLLFWITAMNLSFKIADANYLSRWNCAKISVIIRMTSVEMSCEQKEKVKIEMIVFYFVLNLLLLSRNCLFWICSHCVFCFCVIPTSIWLSKICIHFLISYTYFFFIECSQRKSSIRLSTRKYTSQLCQRKDFYSSPVN